MTNRPVTIRPVTIRPMRPGDRDAVAGLIHESTNAYYVGIGRDPIFPGPSEEAAVFVDVYDALDPGCGLVAVVDDRGTGGSSGSSGSSGGSGSSETIAGSCFVHPRDTHVSLGIMNVHPAHFGRGVARRLLETIIAQAQPRHVRLVSSCLNLDSFSLYSRAGFQPRRVVQDVLLAVPEDGLPPTPTPDGLALRDATADDAAELAALTRDLTGLDRGRDADYLLSGTHPFWTASVAIRDGRAVGWLASCGAAAVNMIGPGCAADEPTAIALAHRELDRHRGRSPVMLVPSDAREVLAAAYGWGGRNVELHLVQSTGPLPTGRGVEFCTFLPE